VTVFEEIIVFLSDVLAQFLCTPVTICSCRVRTNQTQMSTPPSMGRKMRYYLPSLSWLPAYNSSYLTGDLLAALSVSVIMVPQVLHTH
jgi:hypothetical protein